MQSSAAQVIVTKPISDANHAVLNSQQGKCYQFRFHGSASEYFGIWLVNIVLTIFSFTLYAPWAKTRRMRYFYGNTQLLDKRFDFVGLPSKILLGRLLTFELYAVSLVLTNYSLLTTSTAFLLLVLFIPWLFRLSLKFKARNSKFGNIRFRFVSSNRQAYRVFFLAVIVNFVTLFLFFPVLIWFYKCFCLNHLEIGKFKFNLNVKWSKFMSALYLPLAIYILAAIVFGVIAKLFFPNGIAGDVLKYTGGIVYFVLLLLLWPMIMARLFMTTWNNVQLDKSYFKTTVNPWRYAWIVLSNWIGKILSLGLLTPWANIRLYEYQISSLQLYLQQDLADLEQQLQQESSAIPDEIMSFLDFDASL